MNMTKYCLPLNPSACWLIGTMVTSLNEKDIIKMMKMITKQHAHTGIDTANHWIQLGAGSINCKPTTFCGDAIGEAIPATLDASAIPKTNAWANWFWTVFPLTFVSFNVFKIGWTTEYINTGAATLETKAATSVETTIIANNIGAGFCLTFESKNVHADLSRLCLESAAARVKPPSKSKIIGDHIAAQMNLDASDAVKTSPVSGSFNTFRMTSKNGNNNEVVKSGMASEAHKREQHIKTAKQFFCWRSWNGDHSNNAEVMRVIIIIFHAVVDANILGISICLPAPKLNLQGSFSLMVAGLAYAAWDFLSIPIMSLQTVFLSKTTFSRKLVLSSSLASLTLLWVKME